VLDEAEQHYLAALALQPDNAAAAQALRDLERARVRRQVLGRPARVMQPVRTARQAVPVMSSAVSEAEPID
jgi:hypothetical protein